MSLTTRARATRALFFGVTKTLVKVVAQMDGDQVFILCLLSGLALFAVCGHLACRKDDTAQLCILLMCPFLGLVGCFVYVACKYAYMAILRLHEF